jgi:hypothetical protein
MRFYSGQFMLRMWSITVNASIVFYKKTHVSRHFENTHQSNLNRRNIPLQPVTSSIQYVPSWISEYDKKTNIFSLVISTSIYDPSSVANGKSFIFDLRTATHFISRLDQREWDSNSLVMILRMSIVENLIEGKNKCFRTGQHEHRAHLSISGSRQMNRL